MKRKTLLILLFVAAGVLSTGGLFAQTADDLNEGTQLEYDATNEIYRYKWWGRTGRTYFIQHTEDLILWNWVPVVESGDDAVKEWGLTTTADKFFLRLRYTDIPTTDPENDDFDGDTVPNLFEISNGFSPFATTDANTNGIPDEWELYNAGKFNFWPPALSASLTRNATETKSLFLRNDTATPVSYSVALTGNTGPSHTFEDSLTGSATYNWQEISETGTRLSVISNAYLGQETVTLTQFSFPFFGTSFNAVHVSVNGAVSLGQTAYMYDNYYPLPSPSAPRNMIAAFYDDLDTRTIGDIYYKQESDRLIIQYQNVGRSYGTASDYTFQIVLYADGKIAFLYKEMDGTLNSATIGIQNGAGTIGLQVAHNATYVSDNHAVLISPQSTFLSVAPTSGTVPAFTTLTLDAVFRSLSLPYGTHTATITTTHDAAVLAGPHVMDATLEVFNAPAQVAVTAPLDGSVFLEGEAITITATASDPEGMQKVQFYQGATLLGEDSSSPYSRYWGYPAPGAYVLTANAVDIFGGVTTSDPINVTIIPDADRDGLPDSWEAANGLSSSDFSDALADTDGDRIPNLWEHRLDTNPNEALSRPPTTRVVAADGSGDHLTLQEAYDAAADLEIIEVRSGTYDGLYMGSEKRIAWLATPASPTALVKIKPAQSNWTTTQTYSDAVFDGFSIEGHDGTVAYISSSRVAFTNCKLTNGNGYYYPGAIYAAGDTTISLYHCTILDNRYLDEGYGWGANAIQGDWDTRIAIKNSILWNPDANGLPEILSYGSVVVTSSIIRGGDFGAIDQNPGLAYGGWMNGNSPGLDAGTNLEITLDAQGESRHAGIAPDLGWDEFRDADTDGLPDWLEALGITDPEADFDSDGLSNLAEYQTHLTNIQASDTDGDGLLDGVEVLTHGTNPLSTDTDSDGMADAWEVANGLNALIDDAQNDLDNDGLTNLFEYTWGFDPTDPSDVNRDTDSDGLPDLWEITYFKHATSALPSQDPDTDDLTNLQEYLNTTEPNNWDTDGDLLPDGWEIANGLNARSGTGAEGANGDPDNDGLSNFKEWTFGASPHSSDTDGDGVSDGQEAGQGSSPSDPSDNGQPPSEDQLLEMKIIVGDPSGSHSERWRVEVRDLATSQIVVNHASQEFGELSPDSESIFRQFRKGKAYDIKLIWVATDPEKLEEDPEGDFFPDYDWALEISYKNQEGLWVDVKDQQAKRFIVLDPWDPANNQIAENNVELLVNREELQFPWEGQPDRTEQYQQQIATKSAQLLPIEIVIPKLNTQGSETGELQSTTNLSVGTLENSFDSTASRNLVADWIEEDRDRFYIRVTDPGKSGQGPLRVRVWTDSEGTEYDDDSRISPDSNVVELQEEGTTGVFISKSMLLVSNDGDDDHSVDGVADDDKNDRTRLIALGGKINVEFLENGQTPNYEADIEATTPVIKTVKVKVWVAKTALLGTPTPVVNTATVEADLKSIRETFAQAGIKVVSNPTIVEFNESDAGIDLSPTGFDYLTNGSHLTDEAKAVFDWIDAGSQRAADEISIIYVNFMTTNWYSSGANGPRGLAYINKMFSPPKYANHLIIAADYRLRYTAPHELLHILLDAEHSDFLTEHNHIRMTFSGDNGSNAAGIEGRKRISKRSFNNQVNTIQASPYAN